MTERKAAQRIRSRLVVGDIPPRRQRLYACYCIRHTVVDLLDDHRSALAVDEAEMFALTGSANLERARTMAANAASAFHYPRGGADDEARFPRYWAALAAYYVVSTATTFRPRTVVNVLRAVALAVAGAAAVKQRGVRHRSMAASYATFERLLACTAGPEQLPRLPADVVTHPLVICGAEAAFLDCQLGDLPILADAMEEAGCTDAQVLGHLRDPGPHARCCWVLDAILGTRYE